MLCFLTKVRSSGNARVGVMHGKAVGKSFQPHLNLGSEGCWAGGPGRIGEGGTRLGRFGLRQDLAEAFCCLTANCLARMLERCVVSAVLTPHPAAIGVMALLQHAGSTPAQQQSHRGGQHPEEPRIHWISSRSDPQTMDSCSHRREGVGSDTLRPQARVRGDALPVNCFCLMNCSFFSAAADKSN